MDNPELVLNGIINEGQTSIVKNVTIRRYALLEKIKSPLVTPGAEFSTESIIQTIFIMCAENSELKSFTTDNLTKLVETALDWTDEHIQFKDVNAIISKIADQLLDINNASPEVTVKQEESKKK